MSSASTAVHDPRAAPTRAMLAQVGEYSNQAGSLDSCALIVELEGLPYDYAFNEGDLVELFSRYGPVKTVQFLDSTIAPDIALVEFQSTTDAVSAVQNLHNYSIPFDGYQVVLAVNYYDESVDKSLQGKLRVAAAMALQQNGPEAIMTGSKYTSRGPSSGGWHCRFVIGAEKMEREFPVVGRIIGPQGSHMKSIHEKTTAKLRLRGRRSNFREGPDNKETDDPMHLCVSSNDEVAFRRACEMVETLMAGVYGDYSNWCQHNNVPIPAIQLICVDGPFTDPLEWKLRDFFANQAQMMARGPPM